MSKDPRKSEALGVSRARVWRIAGKARGSVDYFAAGPQLPRRVRILCAC